MAKFNKQDKGESGPMHQSLKKALGHHVNKGHLTMTHDSAGDDTFDDFKAGKKQKARAVPVKRDDSNATIVPGSGKGKRTFPKKKLALD